MKLIIALVAAIVSLAFASVARADLAVGIIAYTNGSPCNACTVHIHNDSTGANGSTYTASNGSWNASVTANTEYAVWAEKYQSCFHWWTNTTTILDPYGGGGANAGTQYLVYSNRWCVLPA